MVVQLADEFVFDGALDWQSNLKTWPIEIKLFTCKVHWCLKEYWLLKER
jgi:hypothetical protein